MNLVDVHCHLNHREFKGDLNKVISRAKKAGLKAIIVSGVNPPANREVLELAKTESIIKVSLGIYPIDALGLSEGETGLPRQTEKIDLETEFKFIREHKNEIVAVGEVGMDFFWDKEHHEQQKDNLKKIINFVKSVKKPIIIHSRKAEQECIDLLEQEINSEIPVIMHCFSGNKKLIKRSVELGYYFSVPPNIIKLQHFQTLVQMVPLTQLFTETDAPWLSPFSEQKNEPAFVVEAIKKIAELKNISSEEAAAQIWKNYQLVFENHKP